MIYGRVDDRGRGHCPDMPAARRRPLPTTAPPTAWADQRPDNSFDMPQQPGEPMGWAAIIMSPRPLSPRPVGRLKPNPSMAAASPSASAPSPKCPPALRIATKAEAHSTTVTAAAATGPIASSRTVYCDVL